MSTVVVGCTAPTPEARFDAEARWAVEAAVDSATRSFHAAEVARDADAAVAHLARDFYMYGDGVRSEYAEVAAGIRATMPGLRAFHSEWTDLQVRALGADAAVASFLFRDSIVAADGTVTVLRGPSTLIWERRHEDWLIVYVDADHYPPE